MIFKIFNSDNGFLSKIGVFNKSFTDIGKAFGDALANTLRLAGKGVLDDSVGDQGFFNNLKNNLVTQVKEVSDLEGKLFVTKENIEPFLIKDFSIYEKDPSDILNKLQQTSEKAESDSNAWQKYFGTLEEGEKWQEKFVQANDLTKVSLDNVKNAQNDAKKAAIAYNKRLQQMTIRAKAAELGMKALSMAGNLIVSWAIGEAISLAVKGLDNFVNAADKAKEAAEKAASEIKSLKEEVKEANEFVGANKDKYAEYAKGVSIAGENVSLTAEQFKEYHDITNQIAEKFPSMISGFDSEGNAILKNKGNVEELTKALNDYNKEKAKEAFNKIEDVVEGSNAEIHGKGLQIGENTRYRDTQDALKVLAGDKDVSKLRLVAFSQSSAEDLGLRKKGFFESIDSYKEYLQENIETVQQGTKEFSEKIDDLLLVIC